MASEFGAAQIAGTLLEELASPDRLRWKGAVRRAALGLAELRPLSSVESEFRDLTISIVEGLETSLQHASPAGPSSDTLAVYRALLHHVSRQSSRAALGLSRATGFTLSATTTLH